MSRWRPLLAPRTQKNIDRLDGVEWFRGGGSTFGGVGYVDGYIIDLEERCGDRADSLSDVSCDDQARRLSPSNEFVVFLDRLGR